MIKYVAVLNVALEAPWKVGRVWEIWDAAWFGENFPNEMRRWGRQGLMRRRCWRIGWFKGFETLKCYNIISQRFSERDEEMYEVGGGGSQTLQKNEDFVRMPS